MTVKEQQTITKLRESGLSLKEIENKTGISYEALKSWFRRHDVKKRTCEACGAQIDGPARKRFCSDKCRFAWWNGHRDCSSGESMITVPCSYCGRPVTGYPSKKRKYCSRECFLKRGYSHAPKQTGNA